MDDLKLLLTILIPLVIIMDPLGNLPFFLLFTRGAEPSGQRKIAALATLTACLILMFFVLTGDFVLRFFSIELAAFQLAGGFIFFIYALQMLRLIPSGVKTSEEEEEEGVKKDNVALVPLATPLLAGPGAITAVLVWQGNRESPLGIVTLMAAIVLACVATCGIFFFGPWIRRVLGLGGIRVATRLMGLLLAVIAVQFMVSGFQQIK
jgi:multiple antibiotic resistance protein